VIIEKSSRPLSEIMIYGRFVGLAIDNKLYHWLGVRWFVDRLECRY